MASTASSMGLAAAMASTIMASSEFLTGASEDQVPPFIKKGATVKTNGGIPLARENDIKEIVGEVVYVNTSQIVLQPFTVVYKNGSKIVNTAPSAWTILLPYSSPTWFKEVSMGKAKQLKVKEIMEDLGL